MASIDLTPTPSIERLRWVMVGAILFSILITLAGQPESFWRDPKTAMRGDGLSIYNPTNRTFDFFLGHGWQAYIAASLIYLGAAYLLVSLLPRVLASIAIFSFLFGHFFGASNWLAVRWHLGTNGPTMYGIVLGAVIAFSAFPAPEGVAPTVKRLRWLVPAALSFDLAVTLAGQPRGYWQHPERVHEANQLSRFFLERGWIAFVLYGFLLCVATFWLVSALPKRVALGCIFYFILAGFNGASCWFFYEWRLGMAAPVVYGIVLSAIVVLSAFAGQRVGFSRQSVGLGFEADEGKEPMAGRNAALRGEQV